MLWLLAVTAWVLISLLIAPAMGRVLALHGRPPRPRTVHFHRLASRVQ